MKIADFSAQHPVIITILLVTLLVFGGLAAANLIQEMFPPVELPTVAIVTTYPGAGPEEVERDVTEVLEDALARMSGLQQLSSESSNSVSFITAEFEPGTDLDLTVPDVRERIARVGTRLPEDIDGQPRIMRFSATFVPVLVSQVRSSADQASLTRYLEDSVVPRLSQISGVSDVALTGARDEQVRIELNPDKLEARGITPLEVQRRLQTANMSIPAGEMRERGEMVRVRTEAEFDSLTELRSTAVGSHRGSTVRLQDVATVTRGLEEPEVYVRSDGQDIVVISMQKQMEGDTNAIVREAKEIFREVEEEQRGNIQFVDISDTSKDITRAISSVRNAALTGAALAILVLLIFLHDLRYTLIIALSIPFSVLVTFGLMYTNDQTLNLLSLGGMTVGIGLMVDSSIVVLENVSRNMEIVPDSQQAISRGVSQVGGAIIASTTTSLSVFVPVLFVQGLTGITLRDPSTTIIFALAASLLAAIVVVPYLTSVLVARHGPRHFGRFHKDMARRVEGGIKGLTALYARLLRGALARKGLVFTVALAVLVMSVLSVSFLGFSFVPQTDSGEFVVDVRAPSSYSLEQTREKTDAVEREIRRLVPEVSAGVFWVGQEDQFSMRSLRYRSFGRFRLVPLDERDRRLGEIIDVLRRELATRIADAEITVRRGGLNATVAQATGGPGFTIRVQGPNLDNVLEAGKQVRDIVGADPNVFDAVTDVRYGQRELLSQLDLEQLDSLGIAPQSVGATTRIMFDGVDAGEFSGGDAGDEPIDIRLGSSLEKTRLDESALNDVQLRNAAGRLVPLASVTELRSESSVPVIYHENRLPAVTVTGYLQNENVRGVTERVTSQLEETTLPPGVSYELAGSGAQVQSSFVSLIMALLVSVFLVYVVMVIQFERFVQPLVVMASVPFTLIGVILGLLLFQAQLSIISFLGIIALAGIVVNNAIVLIHYINLLRREFDYGLYEAIVEGASTRLRPILMTTLTTLLGITPLALGLGEGSKTYAPLGQAVFGGLITSTLITLVVVPVLYHVVEGFLERRRRSRHA